MGKVQAIKTGLSIVRRGANSFPKGKLDPKTLGYIAPDGTINFQNEESAVKYIFNRLHESLALPQEQQFERLLVKKNSSILGEVDGTADYIAEESFEKINGMKKRKGYEKYIPVPRDIEVFHSHTDSFCNGQTQPLSGSCGCGDLNMFSKYKLKKLVAVNSKMEFNSLEATKDLDNEKFMIFEEKSMEVCIQRLLPPELFKEYKAINKRIKEMKIFSASTLNNLLERRKQILKQASDYEDKIIKTEENAYIQHEMLKIADKYGMKYRTNFSNLLEYDVQMQNKSSMFKKIMTRLKRIFNT